MGNQVLNGSSLGQLNNSICPKSVFGRDIYGNLIDFDRDVYKFDDAFEMYHFFLQIKFYNQSLYSSESSTSAELHSFEDDSELKWLRLSEGQQQPNGSFVDENDDFYRRPEYLASIHEFLHHLSPAGDPDGAELEKQIMMRKLLTVFAYSTIILISLFGNLLVLFIILSRSRLRVQTTNKLIANLTLSDCMLTVLTIPLTIGKFFFVFW